MARKNELKITAYVIALMTININDLDLDNVLLNKKSYGNIYCAGYKTAYDVKLVHIIFDIVDR